MLQLFRTSKRPAHAARGAKRHAVRRARLDSVHLTPFIRERLAILRGEGYRTSAAVFMALSLVVVSCVAVVLHMRALAQVHTIRYLACPMTSGVGHYHDQTCYDEEGNLVCPLEEVELHYHDESCYDDEGELVCDLVEGGELHQHGPGCFDEIVVDDEGNIVDGDAQIQVEPDGQETASVDQTLEAIGGEVFDSVSVNAPAAAGVPEGSELRVTELGEGDLSYDDYVQQVSQALGDGAEMGTVLLCDISIERDDVEVQPCEDVGVTISITQAVAEGMSDNVRVVHFGPDGPELIDARKDGQVVTFATDGFSVYAIVEAPDPVSVNPETIGNLADFEAAVAQGEGLYLSLPDSFGSRGINGDARYCSNGLNSNNAFIEVHVSSATEWFFEQVQGSTNPKRYRIYYEDDNGGRHYMKQIGTGNTMQLTDTQSDATSFEVRNHKSDRFQIKVAGSNKYLQHSHGGQGIRLYDNPDTSFNNSDFMFELADSYSIPDDPYELDGKTYGICYHNGEISAGGMGSAAVGGNKLAVEDLKIRPDVLDNDGILGLFRDSDLTEWTFENIDEDHYYVKTHVGDAEKYLTINGTSLTLEDSPQAGSVITLEPGTGDNKGKYRFVAGGRAINFNSGGFTTTNKDDATSYLNLVEAHPTLEDDDIKPYTAHKVSVSDTVNVYDGAQIIVYTRVWNDDDKCYDFYAVNNDGTLIRVYESGSELEWYGPSVNYAAWEFNEHFYDNMQTTNYYELKSVIDGNYIAPQLDGQILSNDPIGLNLNGRRNMQNATTILAWDDVNYAYAGLKVDDDCKHVVACPIGEACDFFFAIIPEPSSGLNEVETIDNGEYGITMKMIDYDNAIVSVTGADNKSYTRDRGQTDILGVGEYRAGLDGGQTGLLKPYLESDGYPLTNPSVTGLANETSLSGLYGAYQGSGMPLTDVNHLFIKNTYIESGYFEYDSTKNFAHLNQQGENAGRFTVYEQLAAIGTATGPTRTHGQFMPLNDIDANRLADTYNLTDVYGNELPDTYPRKGEQLYLIPDKGTGAADYYFGMEMEAGFTQTPSGLDAWDHDIIFEFSGDDDFWLYVDGRLAIDLGGVHQAQSGSINFRTGKIVTSHGETTLREAFRTSYAAETGLDPHDAAVDAWLATQFEEKVVDGETCYVFPSYTNHTMKMLYMERGAGASNLHMRFNLASVKPGHVYLEKHVTGTESSDFDLDEFAYQVFYTTDPNETDPANFVQLPPVEQVSGGTQHNITYYNSTDVVPTASSYTPTNGPTYSDVFLIKPNEGVEINLPPGTARYYIKECGVSDSTYDVVEAMGGALSPQATGVAGYSDYAIDPASPESAPRVTYTNNVKEGALRTLSINKQLFAPNGDPLDYNEDDTEFTFRLYLGDENSSELSLAYIEPYCVKNKQGEYCEWDAANQCFRSLGKTSYGDLTAAEKVRATFHTSINGAISKIPVDHTVEVRDLVEGVRYRVVERESEVPDGYEFIEYVRTESGSADTSTSVDQEQGIISSIQPNSDATVDVENRRGIGIAVEKTWSDEDYVDARDPVYFALYEKGANDQLTLLPDSVRQMPFGTTSRRWFFASPPAGKTLDDYVVREVRLTGAVGTDYVVDQRGKVTRKPDGTSFDDTTVQAIGPNGFFDLDVTPKNGSPTTYTYNVIYAPGEVGGNADNVRTDVVRNTRDGIRICKMGWDGTTPLAGAVFTLKDDQQRDVGQPTYTSGADGLVTVAFLPDGVYTLEEKKAAPEHQSLAGPLTITVQDGAVTLSGDAAVTDACSYVDKDPNVAESQATITVRDKAFTLAFVKTGGDGSGLADVHFALYRQVVDGNGNLRPDLRPLEGYGDMVTNASGVIEELTQALPADTYYLRETQTVGGYEVIGHDLLFTLSSAGEITLDADAAWSLATDDTTTPGVVAYTVTVINERSLQKVYLQKVDDAGANLSGSAFELDKWEGTGEPSATGSGWAQVEADIRPGDAASATANPVLLDAARGGLTIGTYRLVETAVPDGHVITHRDTMFSVEKDATDGSLKVELADDFDGTVSCDRSTSGDEVIYTVTIQNPAGEELPHSGGAGTAALYAIGAALVAAGGLLLARRRTC